LGWYVLDTVQQCRKRGDGLMAAPGRNWYQQSGE